MRNFVFSLLFFSCIFLSGCMVSEDELNKGKAELVDLRRVIQEKDSEISRLQQVLKASNEKLALFKRDTPEASGTLNPPENLSVEEEYIANFIDVYDINAKYFKAILDGRIPGIEFKIKNRGIKTITYLKIVFYFKDSKDNVIFEDYYFPLSGGFSEEKTVLKPNYIWKMESGKFYSAKKCPEEWKEGNVSYKIEKIEIE